ncbi:hypothetical protein BH23ACT5_BH23ACT5_17740 [soil metagenome]
MTIDPRLQDRRRRVAEDRARSNLSRLIRLLAVVAFGALVAWVLQSPFLSVGHISVVGNSSRVDAGTILAAHGIVEGRPMVVLDVGTAEEALGGHPWVAEVRVARNWPTSVSVEITERTPAVSVRFADGWALLAADATVLETVPSADPVLPEAEFRSVDSEDGSEDLEVIGAVNFLVALPPERRGGATVSMSSEGLEAVVAGYRVRLGRPFDMVDKAVVTAELIGQDLEPGSIITVVAPASPAVLPPGAAPEMDPEDPDGTDDAGEAQP